MSHASTRCYSRETLERAGRRLLVPYLEARGFTCYPEQSIRELRETALEISDDSSDDDSDDCYDARY